MENRDVIEIKRTDSTNEDFRTLVRLLDKELADTYREEYEFYHQYNQIENIKNVVVLSLNGQPVGCGAIKKFDVQTMEVKRMYTLHTCRGKGIASKVLGELEKWTKELSYKKCILETGTKQHAAIALYKKKGYVNIPNYGQYENVESSVCFIKILSIKIEKR